MEGEDLELCITIYIIWLLTLLVPVDLAIGQHTPDSPYRSRTHTHTHIHSHMYTVTHTDE